MGAGGGPGRHLDGTVLELLDIDAETLRDALQGGSTLAEVAEFYWRDMPRWILSRAPS